MMLRVENLTIHFEENAKQQEVVKQVTFSMNQGEILGLVGESGSGKSMTALTIAGLPKAGARQDEGRITFCCKKGDEVSLTELDKNEKRHG